MTSLLIGGLTIAMVLANGSLLCCLVLRLVDDRRDVADARNLGRALTRHNGYGRRDATEPASASASASGYDGDSPATTETRGSAQR